MYSTEQLLDILNKRLEEYEKEAIEIEEAADKSANPREYRLTDEYIKNKIRAEEKIRYIESVILKVEEKAQNMQSVNGSIAVNLRDKAIIRNLGYMHSGNSKRIERLKEKNGQIEEKQRKIVDKKYNRITKRIEKQAEISSELEKTYAQGYNTKDKIRDIPDKIENYKQELDNWRSLGILGLFSGKELPNFVKKTLVFGYTVGSYAKKYALQARLLRLEGKRVIYEVLNKRVINQDLVRHMRVYLYYINLTHN